jgi:GAF domain-containing protein
MFTVDELNVFAVIAAQAGLAIDRARPQRIRGTAAALRRLRIITPFIVPWERSNYSMIHASKCCLNNP